MDNQIIDSEIFVNIVEHYDIKDIWYKQNERKIAK